MKPGDLVRQAPNIFADREIGGVKMLVIRVEDHPAIEGKIVTVFVNGSTRQWHDGELEKV